MVRASGALQSLSAKSAIKSSHCVWSQALVHTSPHETLSMTTPPLAQVRCGGSSLLRDDEDSYSRQPVPCEDAPAAQSR